SLAFSIERFGKALPQGLRDGEHAFYLPGTRPLIRHGGLSLCIWHDVANQRPGLYFLDEAGTLLRLFTDQNSMRWCKVMHPRALALTRTGSAMCYAVYEEPDGVGQVRVSLGDRSAPVQSWPSSQAPCQAFFGYGSVSDNLLFGLLAVNYTGEHWEILNSRGRTAITVPRGFSVHGVLQDDNWGETLIVVEDDRQTLSLYGARGAKRLLRAKSPIRMACGCQQLPLIAYSTEAGHVAVYSLAYGKVLMNFE